MQRTLTTQVLVLLSLLLFAGCGGGGGGGTPTPTGTTSGATSPPTETVIGPAGGTLQAGSLALTIPAGALAGDAAFTASWSQTPTTQPANDNFEPAGPALTIASSSCQFMPQANVTVTLEHGVGDTLLVVSMPETGLATGQLLPASAQPDDVSIRTTTTTIPGAHLGLPGGSATLSVYRLSPRRNIFALHLGNNPEAWQQPGQLGPDDRLAIAIHGINSGPGSVNQLVTALNATGRYADVARYQYPYPDGADTAALALRDILVGQTMTIGSGVPIDCYGVSFGGSVARYLVQELPELSVQGKFLVTIGTPHLGSPLTAQDGINLLLNTAGGGDLVWHPTDLTLEQLQPGSDFERDLAPGLPRYLSQGGQALFIGGDRFPLAVGVPPTDLIDRLLADVARRTFATTRNDGVVSLESAFAATQAVNASLTREAFEVNHATIANDPRVHELIRLSIPSSNPLPAVPPALIGHQPSVAVRAQVSSIGLDFLGTADRARVNGELVAADRLAITDQQATLELTGTEPLGQVDIELGNARGFSDPVAIACVNQALPRPGNVTTTISYLGVRGIAISPTTLYASNSLVVRRFDRATNFAIQLPDTPAWNSGHGAIDPGGRAWFAQTSDRKVIGIRPDGSIAAEAVVGIYSVNDVVPTSNDRIWALIGGQFLGLFDTSIPGALAPVSAPVDTGSFHIALEAIPGTKSLILSEETVPGFGGKTLVELSFEYSPPRRRLLFQGEADFYDLVVIPERDLVVAAENAINGRFVGIRLSDGSVAWTHSLPEADLVPTTVSFDGERFWVTANNSRIYQY